MPGLALSQSHTVRYPAFDAPVATMLTTVASAPGAAITRRTLPAAWRPVSVCRVSLNRVGEAGSTSVPDPPNQPVTSTITSAATDDTTQTAPEESRATTAPLAAAPCFLAKLTVDTLGMFEPHGYTVAYPAVAGPAIVRFTVAAVAPVAGTPAAPAIWMRSGAMGATAAPIGRLS